MACGNYWLSPFQVGSHQLARGFVKKGWEVAFISDPISPLHFLAKSSEELRRRYELYVKKGLHDLNDQLWAYVPGALLTPHNKPFLRTEWLHRNWYSLTFPNLISFIFQKGFGEVDLLYFDSPVHSFWLNKIRFKKSVFRVADNSVGFSKYSKSFSVLERYLAQSVDTVIYTAENLKAHIENLRPRAMYHVPNGVNFEHFSKTQAIMPVDLNGIPRPIAIYVGAMDSWFDYELVNQIAESLPNISFVFIGPDRNMRAMIKNIHNIYLLGSRNYTLLPEYLAQADVGIIPFNVKKYPELVNSVNPLKLYEYMAAGLPVVATEWQELKNLKSPAILCKSSEEFVEGIKLAISKKADKSEYQNYAKTKDWNQTINHLLGILDI
jgi:glycosyltransferase involved in cell wall biosynthesis